MDDDNYTLKQQIPVEAVYAYIEVKHTLTLEGEGPQSLHKAASQVAAVKALPREPVTVRNAFHPYLNFANLRSVNRKNFPNILNPLFGAIFARQIRIKPNTRILNSNEKIVQALNGASIDPEPSPDLIIAGPDVVLLPNSGSLEESNQVIVPFFVKGQTMLGIRSRPGLAFAAGICSLIGALDLVILGHIDWPGIVADALSFRANS
jgi:hypothetical protein